VGLVEREPECHRHLDDLLPSLADASTRTGDTLPRDVEDVYKHRRDTHRVSRAPFHPRDRSHHHSGQECTAHVCVCLCLDHVLR